MQLQEHSEFQAARGPSEKPKRDEVKIGSEDTSMSNQIMELITELKNDINKQFDRVDAKFDKMDARLDKMDAKFDKVTDEFTAVRKEIANIEKTISDKFGSLYKWALGILVVALVSTVAKGWF